MTRRDRSVSLSDEDWAALDEIARIEDRSVASLIRLSVGGFLAARGRGQEWGSHAEILNPMPPATETGTAPGNRVYEVRMGTRDPDDEEARLLREAYPNLKEPKVVDPNARKKR